MFPLRDDVISDVISDVTLSRRQTFSYIHIGHSMSVDLMRMKKTLDCLENRDEIKIEKSLEIWWPT